MITILSDGDMIVGTATGAEGIPLPLNLVGIRPERLRLINGAVVDVMERTDWFIDQSGRKRTIADAGWQAMSCPWDAILIQADGTWRIRLSSDDLIAYARQKRIEALTGVAVTPHGTCWLDQGTRADLGQIIQLLDEGLAVEPVAVKLASGFVSLTRAQVIAVIASVAAVVMGAFASEGLAVQGVAAQTITTQAQIDAFFA